MHETTLLILLWDPRSWSFVAILLSFVVVVTLWDRGKQPVNGDRKRLLSVDYQRGAVWGDGTINTYYAYPDSTRHNSLMRIVVFDRGKLPLSEVATNLELSRNYLGGANRGDGNHKIYYSCLHYSWVLGTYSCVCDPSITVAHTSWQWLFIWNRARRSLAEDRTNLDMDMIVDHLEGANRGNGTFNFLYAYLDSSWFYTCYFLFFLFSSVTVGGLRHNSSTRFGVFDAVTFSSPRTMPASTSRGNYQLIAVYGTLR